MGKEQLDDYQEMAEQSEKVSYYIHLEDIDLVRKLWGVWIPPSNP